MNIRCVLAMLFLLAFGATAEAQRTGGSFGGSSWGSRGTTTSSPSSYGSSSRASTSSSGWTRPAYRSTPAPRPGTSYRPQPTGYSPGYQQPSPSSHRGTIVIVNHHHEDHDWSGDSENANFSANDIGDEGVFAFMAVLFLGGVFAVVMALRAR